MAILLDHSIDTIRSTINGIELVSELQNAYNAANGAFTKANTIPGAQQTTYVADTAHPGLTVNTGVNITLAGNNTLILGANSATTGAVGVVQLTDSVLSISTTTAATPNSVNTVWSTAQVAILLANSHSNLIVGAYANANAALAEANAFQSIINSAFTLANSTTNLVTGAYANANAALAEANAFQSIVNSVFTLANSHTVSITSVQNLVAGAYANANGAFAEANAFQSIINSVFTLANTHTTSIASVQNLVTGAYANANAALAEANAFQSVINSAFTLANSTTNLVTGAYTRANASVLRIGDSMSGVLYSNVYLGGNAFQGAIMVTSTANGSGINGPQTAQVGVNINHQKINWNTVSAAVGEIDGQYITVRQGGVLSDAGGLLIDVAGTGNGFLAIDEAVVAKINVTTGNTTQRIRTQEGSINTITGDYIGKLLVAEVGNLSCALQVQNVSGNSYWGNILTNLRDGIQNYIIRDDGTMQSNSQVITGFVNIQGQTSNTVSGGTYLMWNKGLGDGYTWLLNQKGSGAGGFIFGSVDSAGVITGNTTIDVNGNITACGNLNIVGVNTWVNTLRINTAASIVGVDIGSGLQNAYNAANASFSEANGFQSIINSVFTLANSHSNLIVGAYANANAAFAEANGFQSIINSVFTLANTHTTSIASVQNLVTGAYANANAAFAEANAFQSIINSAFTLANTSNLLVAMYDPANNVINMGGVANTRGVQSRVAYANGNFANIGDAQIITTIVRNRSTGSGNTINLSTSGANTTTNVYGIMNQIQVANNALYAFCATVAARDVTNMFCKVWDVKGGIKNTVGPINTIPPSNTTIMGSPVINIIAADNGTNAWTIAVATDLANNALLFTASGSPNTTNWVAGVTTVEVA